MKSYEQQLIGSGAFTQLVTHPDASDGAPGVEPIERFQSLEPGYYWTAVKALDQRVAAQETLLLLDITHFDGYPHSVTLRKHPRYGEGSIDLLVDEFLDAFIPDPDGERTRANEQQTVMQEVTALQNTLLQVQADPALMQEVLREELAKGIAQFESEQTKAATADTEHEVKRAQDLGKVHRRAARRSAAAGNPLVAPKAALARDLGSFIEAGINSQGVRELRSFAGRQAVVARVQQEWLQAQTKEIASALAKLGPYMSERSAVALARASGALKSAENLRRGIESLDLYVGNGVDVFDIRTGASAPASVPLSIIQGKRYAEEELAAWADVDSTFDFQDQKAFFDALATNEDLLAQVLPFARCVVSIAIRRNGRDYGDSVNNYYNNKENLKVFLLVRNGQNVHVVYSNSRSHEDALRLFPTMEELEAPFRGLDGEKISIQDVQFSKRANAVDDIALVYRRFLILLCGLDHRLNLFGRFYPPDEQLRFMSAEFQANHFNFVCDEDKTRLIGEQMLSLPEWFGEKNGMLQSGSRVFLLDGGKLRTATPELARRRSLRTTPDQFAAPFVAYKEGGSILVSIEVRDRYGDSGDTGIKARCQLTPGEPLNVHREAWWICVDDVTVEEVRRYRFSRTHRSMGVAYLRLFRRLERYLEAEATAQADARSYLLRESVVHGGLTAAQAQMTLATAVRNWRASRRGAALPGVDAPAALNEVLSLMVPQGHMTSAMETMLSSYIAATGCEPLLLTRSGKSKLLLYVCAGALDRAPYPDVIRWGWVRRITLEPGKTKLKETGSALAWLTTTLPASEVEIRRWVGLEAWLNEHPEPVTPRHYAQVQSLLQASQEWAPVLRSGPGAGIPADLFDRVFEETLRLNDRNRSKYTIDAVIAIPVAAFSQDGRELHLAYMQEYVATVLHTYGDQEQRRLVALRLSRSQRQRETLVQMPNWRLVSTPSSVVTAHDKPMAYYFAQGNTPSWSRAQIQVNAKRKGSAFLWGAIKRKGGGPSLATADVALSFDRAFAQLKGVEPVHMARSFYKNLARRAADLNRWPTRNHFTSTVEENTARIKRERTVLLQSRYEHPLKAALSPLVWSAEKGRPIANSLFSGPLRQQRDHAPGANG